MKFIFIFLLGFHFSIVFGLGEDRPSMGATVVSETAVPQTVVTVAVPIKSNFDRFIENFWFSDNPRAGGMINVLKENRRLTTENLIAFAHSHGSIPMLEAFLELEGERLLNYQKEELELLIEMYNHKKEILLLKNNIFKIPIEKNKQNSNLKCNRVE